MLVHEGSILVVILNGMRLLKYRLKSDRVEANTESLTERLS